MTEVQLSVGPLLIGWDVGGWNCDKNPSSRDALVVLDAHPYDRAPVVPAIDTPLGFSTAFIEAPRSSTSIMTVTTVCYRRCCQLSTA